jgi:hypothetical protein
MLVVRAVYAVGSGCNWELGDLMLRSRPVVCPSHWLCPFRWDLVQSIVTSCGRRAVRWCSAAWRKGSLAGCFDSGGNCALDYVGDVFADRIDDVILLGGGVAIGVGLGR